MKHLLVLLVLFSACSPINHMLGRQADESTAGMYFNGTVTGVRSVVNEGELSIFVDLLGEDGQKMIILCEGDEKILGKCLKAQPGMKIKTNGTLVHREGLVLKAEYFAVK